MPYGTSEITTRSMLPDPYASDLWVFGYGSLIFRADFPYTDKCPATIQHWSRRFWQGSADHRGTPGYPGRVVTLTAAPEVICWGMAYRIAGNQVDEVLDHLDYREKGGYERLELPLSLEGQQVVNGLTYHATKGNSDYLGSADADSMVRQISIAIGPSGPNREYLLKLEASLKAHGVVDDHVFDLADRLRDLESGQPT
ncbi:MAG: cation transport protein ChaC [Candidatus Azotimanducaceae bacterium]|jgi:cation transport protein ChaC